VTLPLVVVPGILEDEESWRAAQAPLGRKRKLMVPAPAMGVMMAAALLDRFPWFPISRDQITMLLESNVCTDASAYPLLGIDPQPFTLESLSYLRQG